MNLKKRLIISNILTLAIPVIITIIAAFIFGYISLKVLQSDLGYESFKRLLLIRIELFDTGNSLSHGVEELENSDFKEHINERIKGIGGDLVITKGDSVYYSTKEFNNIDIIKLLDCAKDKLPFSRVDLNDGSYMVQVFSIKFKDGINGNVILTAPVEKEANNFLIYLGFLALLFVISFIITNVIMALVISQRILNPVSNLKTAASLISSGNLENEIIEEGDNELMELCRDLEVMRLRLKESVNTKIKYDDDRKMLISSISHDLKTPITSIKGYVEGIMDGIADSPEKIQSYLKTIYSKAGQVDSMIDDLLLYSKLDLNQIPFNYEKTDIESFFMDAAREYELQLEKYNIKISFESKISKPQTVLIDRDKMKRVIINIIENSLKYMNKDNGEIKLILRETGLSVIAEIRDNGAGIPKDKIDKIFDRFFRIDSARSEKKGSGLGLAIAKGIVEGHKGKIWAVSHESDGLSILISLSKIVEIR